MPLPFSREQTYIAGITPVASHDLNAIQDAIVNAYSGQPHAAQWLDLPPMGMVLAGGVPTVDVNGYLTRDVGSNVHVVVPVPVRAGDVVTQWRCRYLADTSAMASIFIGLFHWDGTNPRVGLDGPLYLGISQIGLALNTHESVPFEVTIAAHGSLFFEFELMSAGDKLSTLSVLVERAP
jgi:hypothetical protein